MPINKNHEFEDLNGIKCAIVEKNASEQRVAFLKDLLEFNKYEVIVVEIVPPAVATTSPAEHADQSIELPNPKPASPSESLEQTMETQNPKLFSIGVTDVTFNPTNAIFGRLLKTKAGHVVTLSYWQQKEAVSHDEIPYFEKK